MSDLGPSEEFTARFRHSARVLSDYYRHLLLEIEPAVRAERRFARRYHLGTLVALPFFAAAGAGIGQLPFLARYPGWMFCSILGVCAWALLAAHRASRAFPLAQFRDNTVRLLMSSVADTSDECECAVTISRDSIRFDIDNEAHIYRWARIEDVFEMPGYLAIEFERMEFVILVPEHAFTDEAERAKFRHATRRLHEQSGYGSRSRLGKLINESRPACYVCDYDLPGVDDARCPECGTRFRLSVMRILDAHPVRKSCVRPNVEGKR